MKKRTLIAFLAYASCSFVLAEATQPAGTNSPDHAVPCFSLAENVDQMNLGSPHVFCLKDVDYIFKSHGWKTAPVGTKRMTHTILGHNDLTDYESLPQWALRNVPGIIGAIIAVALLVGVIRTLILPTPPNSQEMPTLGRWGRIWLSTSREWFGRVNPAGLSEWKAFLICWGFNAVLVLFVELAVVWLSGAVIGLAGSPGTPPPHSCTFIDNTLDSDIDVTLDGATLARVPKRKYVCIGQGIPAGAHKFVASHHGKPIDAVTFFVRDEDGAHRDVRSPRVHFVYNVQAKNSYFLKQIEFQRD